MLSLRWSYARAFSQVVGGECPQNMGAGEEEDVCPQTHAYA